MTIRKNIANICRNVLKRAEWCNTLSKRNFAIGRMHSECAVSAKFRRWVHFIRILEEMTTTLQLSKPVGRTSRWRIRFVHSCFFKFQYHQCDSRFQCNKHIYKRKKKLLIWKSSQNKNKRFAQLKMRTDDLKIYSYSMTTKVQWRIFYVYILKCLMLNRSIISISSVRIL